MIARMKLVVEILDDDVEPVETVLLAGAAEQMTADGQAISDGEAAGQGIDVMWSKVSAAMEQRIRSWGTIGVGEMVIAAAKQAELNVGVASEARMRASEES